MENKCPRCGEFAYYCDDSTIEEDGDTLWVNYWCRCSLCKKRWLYTAKFTLDTAWIGVEEEA